MEYFRFFRIYVAPLVFKTHNVDRSLSLEYLMCPFGPKPCLRIQRDDNPELSRIPVLVAADFMSARVLTQSKDCGYQFKTYPSDMFLDAMSVKL